MDLCMKLIRVGVGQEIYVPHLISISILIGLIMVGFEKICEYLTVNVDVYCEDNFTLLVASASGFTH